MINHFNSVFTIENHGGLKFENGEPVLMVVHSKSTSNEHSNSRTAIGELNRDDLVKLAFVIHQYLQDTQPK